MEYLTPQQELQRDILNFIELVLHHYLYRRQIYPGNVFSQRTIYGLKVYQVKKGVLFDYIHDLVEDIKALLNHSQALRINLESDGEIREYLDIDIDKNLRFEDMKFVPPKYERDQLLQKLLFHLDQKMCCTVGYDFTTNYHVNSFSVQIITDGTQDQSSDAKNALIDKWLLEKKLDDTQIRQTQKSNQFTESDDNQQHSQNKQNEQKIIDEEVDKKEKKHNIKLIDSAIFSEMTVGLFYSNQPAQ